MAKRTLKGLDSLPYDILFIIMKLLYVKEVKHTRCRKFRATWVLSRVSRRLREVALHLLFREVVLKPHQDFKTAIARFLPAGKDSDLAISVRTLSMQRNRDYFVPLPSLQLPQQNFPFANLTEFQLPDNTLDDGMAEALGKCAHLRSLTIGCHQDWPHTMLERLPNLTEVHLHMNGSLPSESAHCVPTWLRSPLRTYTSITTLALHDPLYVGQNALEECIGTCQFPNLTVFLIQGGVRSPESLFQFVHDHPTLLEVSADMHTHTFRVEALLKLMDGTGTWDTMEDSETIGPEAKLCTIYYKPVVREPRNLFPPNVVAGVQVACSSFSFTRSHLQSGSPPWCSPFGSPYPRYKCSALALAGLCEGPITPYDPEGDDVMSLVKVLEYVSQVVPDLEELRLHILDQTTMSPYMEWTDDLKQRVLRNLAHLRKLALFWDHCAPSFDACWGIPSLLWGDIPGAHYIPVIDHAKPPVDISECQVKTMTLDDATRLVKTIPPNWIAKGVREVLNVPDEAELDAYDDTLLIRAWEVRNTYYAHWIARFFASACPQLEYFDWYFLSERPFLRWGVEEYGTVLWNHKILRDPGRKGKRSINVFGTLRWTGCIRGDPPPLYPFVGQELERAIEYGDRAWDCPKRNDN